MIPLLLLQRQLEMLFITAAIPACLGCCCGEGARALPQRAAAAAEGGEGGNSSPPWMSEGVAAAEGGGNFTRLEPGHACGHGPEHTLEIQVPTHANLSWTIGASF